MKRLLCLQDIFTKSFQSKISFLRMLLQSNFRGILKKPQSFAKPCLILGNGPSLNDTFAQNSTETFASFDLMAVNAAATSPTFEIYKPKLYILNALTYFYEDGQLSEFYIQSKHELFNALATKTTWEMKLLVPFCAKKSSDFRYLISKNTHLHPLYFNQTPVEGLPLLSHFCYEKGWGMPRPHNVLIPGIMTAIGLGYRTLVIAGADHSWLADLTVNEKNEAMLRHVHFYATEGTSPMKVEDRIERPRRLHEIIQKFYLSFKGYWDIQRYAKSKGVNIYNASSVSMIDAFERKNLEEILTSTPNK